MTKIPDHDCITVHRWGQGSILEHQAFDEALRFATNLRDDSDSQFVAIIVSHDCDVQNSSLEKEPFVELIRARLQPESRPDKQKTGGRSPRQLELESRISDVDVVLQLSVHDRWVIPRDLLSKHQPSGRLPRKERRLLAEWVAKRYIRAAFPNNFNSRFEKTTRKWIKLLRKNSDWIQGVYLDLHTLDELADEKQYRCRILVAIAGNAAQDLHEFHRRRDSMEDAITSLWEKIHGIELVEVSINRTDEITLSELETYQRFDVDWISFGDGTDSTPVL